MSDSDAHGRTRSGPPGWTALVFLALFAVSIPWYLPTGSLRIWLGLPHWVILSLAAVAAVAAFTVFVVSRYWPDDDPLPGPPRAGSGPS